MHIAVAPPRGAVADTIVHRMPAPAKIVALIVFAVLVVATPREWFAAFACYLAAVVIVLVVARVPPGLVARRFIVAAPVVVVALLLPVIATGERVEVWGVPLAVEGMWGAWALLAKAIPTLGAAIALSATTDPRRIVQALETLRLPRQLTSILAFMVRYLDLIVDEWRRMAIARTARGFEARGPRAWPVLASAVGVLFVRAHARGERVHLAMLARGLDDGAKP